MNTATEYRLMDLCNDYGIPCDLNMLKGRFKVKDKTFTKIEKAVEYAEFWVAVRKDPTLLLRRAK